MNAELQVTLHPHARDRMCERGATEEEVQQTVADGERFVAKFDRVGFRRNFVYHAEWCNRYYATKQIEAYAVEEESGWLVITVITKYF
jgi:hypothetical protein